MANRSLEDFFSGKKERPEYVTDPDKIEDESKRAVVKTAAKSFYSDIDKKNIEKAKDTKVKVEGGKTVMDSGMIDASTILAENKGEDAPGGRKLDRAKLFPPDQIGQGQAPQNEIPGAQPQQQVPAKQDSSFPWDRALIGATPLLVGLLTGNQLEGTQTSADYFVQGEGDLYKRERDLSAKLAQMKVKRETAAAEGGKKRFVAQTIALKDGTNVKAAFDSFTGKYILPDGSSLDSDLIRAGYALNPEEDDRRKNNSSYYKRSDADYLGTNTKIDPNTKQLGIIREGGITPVKGQVTGEFNPSSDS
jgi:hypothetical protein